jgi:hydantoinase/carbamoylase family amidase
LHPLVLELGLFFPLYQINARRLLTTLDELSQFGSTPEGGVSRVCLTFEEVQARKYIFDLMNQSGLKASLDPIGNVIGSLGGGNSSGVVVSGSHIDSVINGGKLDGSYGVVAAIEAARTIRENNLKLSHPLMIICFTDEEGVRFPPWLGSKFIAGLIELDEVYKIRDAAGHSFGDLLSSSGLSIDSKNVIRASNTKFDSFVELHIEQGPILEHEHKNIGLVESIVGILQLNVMVVGSSDHAGTTPMSLRKDALIAASSFVLKVRDLANEFGAGTVGTVGKMDVSPGAPNVIPGSASFTIDFRSNSDVLLQSAKMKIERIAEDIAKEMGVRISVSPRAYSAPVDMSDRVKRTIETSIEEIGLSYKKMVSGAGHDTMVMRRVTDTGMIFVPSRDGKSHSALEKTDPDDLVNGANVLLNSLIKLAA